MENREGILLINKEKGCTSRDVVNQLNHLFHTKKIGHTGTLDPLATGVLVCAIGKYTKLVNYLTAMDKQYIATMKLGIKTDTGDITGEILEQEEVNITQEQINQVFLTFPKEYLQTVPLYSAVKIHGKKLYEYAREKESIKLPARKVKIYSLQIISVKNDEITFKAHVSKGTYIRSLINDIGIRLHTFATMSSLQRTHQGIFSLDECFTMEEIKENKYHLKSLEELFSFPKFELTMREYHRVLNGNKMDFKSQEPFLFLCFQQKIVALYEKKEDSFYPVMVL